MEEKKKKRTLTFHQGSFYSFLVRITGIEPARLPTGF